MQRAVLTQRRYAAVQLQRIARGRSAQSILRIALRAVARLDDAKSAAVEQLNHLEIQIYPRRRAGFSTDIQSRFPTYELPRDFGELEHDGGAALHLN